MLCSPLEPAEGASQFHSAILSWVIGPRPCIHDPPLPWFIGCWGSDLLGREILEIIYLFPLDESGRCARGWGRQEVGEGLWFRPLRSRYQRPGRVDAENKLGSSGDCGSVAPGLNSLVKATLG